MGGVLAAHGGAVGGELATELSLLAPASLPVALRDVLVDITELQPLRWPNGALQELGTGARWGGPRRGVAVMCAVSLRLPRGCLPSRKGAA